MKTEEATAIHNRLNELKEFLNSHDLDEEEYYALESWVSEGNSPYTNPV